MIRVAGRADIASLAGRYPEALMQHLRVLVSAVCADMPFGCRDEIGAIVVIETTEDVTTVHSEPCIESAIAALRQHRVECVDVVGTGNSSYYDVLMVTNNDYGVNILIPLHLHLPWALNDFSRTEAGLD